MIFDIHTTCGRPFGTTKCTVTFQMVEFLIGKGANLDARDKRERRPLHWAAFAGHWDVVRTLVLNGADPTAKDKDVRLSLLSHVCILY